MAGMLLPLSIRMAVRMCIPTTPVVWTMLPVMANQANPKEKGNTNPMVENVDEIPTILESQEMCVKERNRIAKVPPWP